MTAFNVYKGRKKIDTVFYSGNFTTDDVRRSLVGHDGYDDDIRVTKARGPATTEVQHVVQVDYGCGQGFEDVSASTNRAEAKDDLKAYRTNCPQYASRLIKRRVKIGE